MKILSPREIKAVDAYTIAHEPIASVDLMERAASACVDRLIAHFDHRREVVVFAGPGNNGGDGLAIARMLHCLRYRVKIYLLTDDPLHLSPDAAVNLSRLHDLRPVVADADCLPELTPEHLVIDAMFGAGLSRPLDGLPARIAAHINRSKAVVVAIDVPSGLFCDDNSNHHPDTIVRATYTLTFQQPKLSFFFAENAPFTGKWETLDIGLLPEIIDRQPSKNFVLQDEEVAAWFAPREKFSHKGHYGHACIIAGSHNMMGAAILSVGACLRSGAGLVTAHVPHGETALIQLAAPEALASPDVHPEVLSQIPDLKTYTAAAIGPGIGKREPVRQALTGFLQDLRTGKRTSPPLVFDADALNILSESGEGLSLLPPGSIITPHPKEFDRLAGASPNGYRRWCKQMSIARQYGIIVLLKGAHTTVASPDGACRFNITGNPGMATGGSGDVLTGIIVSLLAQGWDATRAACAGAWLHGAAGDRAAKKNSRQALTASDIIKQTGKVLKKIEQKQDKNTPC
ncbi:MAG: NAD(P)H-hydrate dehydratase [Bacteroidales bacterium]|jgi:NAD(P)H-hydrate epimerase|nr:NAD(P)H-hydrate dehydratase [Bacteroidales bacterium]